MPFSSQEDSAPGGRVGWIFSNLYSSVRLLRLSPTCPGHSHRTDCESLSDPAATVLRNSENRSVAALEQPSSQHPSPLPAGASGLTLGVLDWNTEKNAVTLGKERLFRLIWGRRKGGTARESLRLEDSSSVQRRNVVLEMNHCPWRVEQLYSRRREVQRGVRVSRQQVGRAQEARRAAWPRRRCGWFPPQQCVG